MPIDDETVPSIQILDRSQSQARRRPCLIVLSGHTIGRVYPLVGDDVIIGRGSDIGLTIDVPGVSRQHARIRREPDGSFALEDLDSTNGTYVEGKRVTHHSLSDGERLRLGADTVLKFSLQTEVEEAFQKRLYESAVHDHLTRAFNRRYFDEHLSREISHARRHHSPLSLLILDVDHFKQVNDRHGHLCGDEILRGLGTAVAARVRHEDVFCRMGGEEFGVIMRDADAFAARGLAERLRESIEGTPFPTSGGELAITISIGAATCDGSRPIAVAELVEAADQALYEAKGGGRNRVCARSA